MKHSPVVLLSGPSGSGKTTTAGKLKTMLAELGIRSHTISMDDYYRSSREPDYPRDARWRTGPGISLLSGRGAAEPAH